MSTTQATTKSTAGQIGILFVIAGIAPAGMLLTIAGHFPALVSRQARPTVGLLEGMSVLLSMDDPGVVLGTPDLNPRLYWATVIAFLTVLATVVTWLVLRIKNRKNRLGTELAARDGMATRAEVKAASGKAVAKRAATLRPSLTTAAPSDVGYLLGHAHGQEVWITVEDSVLVMGPPRSGKGLGLMINLILDAPGPVIATSTRPDNLTATLLSRMAKGSEIAVFDPQHLGRGLPGRLRWSPVRGCEDPETAAIRALGLAVGTGLGSATNDGFWASKTAAILQPLLHAAAIDGRSAADLARWTTSPGAAGEVVHVLANNSLAAPGWAETLEGTLADTSNTLQSAWQVVSLALAALQIPNYLDAVTPKWDEQFDPNRFLAQSGTLFLMATASGAVSAGPLVAALIEDIIAVAERRSGAMPRARLDPPLLLALDEIGNLAPLPKLPELVSAGGGSGITAIPVLQSLSQARSIWGTDRAESIWESASAKILLPGLSNARDRRDIAAIIGEHDVPVETVTTGADGTRTVSTTTRRELICPPEAIRGLDGGTALALYRSYKPYHLRLRPWTERADQAVITANQHRLEQAMQTAARKALQ